MKNQQAPSHQSHAGLDKDTLREAMLAHLTYSISKYSTMATNRDWFEIAAMTVRDRLVERWMESMQSYYRDDSKRIYYMSLEFLVGRTFSNAILNFNMFEECKTALYELGQSIETVSEVEFDAALGNGGLGRLAACFLDSMATLSLPCYGYGIRYEYGMFHQAIEDGQQVEHPDNWLRYGNPWEFPHPSLRIPQQRPR